MDVPWPSRRQYGAVSMCRSVVVFGGVGPDGTLYNDVWRSDDLGQTWRQLPSPPWEARCDAATGVVGGRILLLSGWVRSGTVRDAWLSDDLGESWKVLPAPPFAARAGAATAVMNGSIVLLGGWSGRANLTDSWRSEDGGVTWNMLPLAPWPARHTFSATVVRDKLLVLGGWQGTWTAGGPLRDAWQSKDGGETWQELPTPAWHARRGHAALSVEGHIYVIGGGGDAIQWARTVGAPVAESDVLCEVWRSDDSGLTWQQLEQPSWAARSEHHALAVGSDHIILLGGAGAGHEQLTDVWWSGGDAEVWIERPRSVIVALVACSASPTSPNSMLASFSTLNGETFEVEVGATESIEAIAARIRHLRGADLVQLVGPDGNAVHAEHLQVQVEKLVD